MAKPISHNEKYSNLPATASGALYLGSLYYFTGKPCFKNHIGLRYASSGNCVSCIEEKRGVFFDTEKTRFSSENITLAINAMADGHLKYTSKSPCPKGHFERFTSSNNCVQCNLEIAINRKEKSRWDRMQKLYGVSRSNFETMLKMQCEQCSICETKLNQKNTHIDHCHKSGKVRSLLCSRCNQAIGLIDESIERLEKIKQYFQRHNHAS